MIDRTTRLRWRRRFRYRKRQVEDMSSQAEENLERHFFRRVGRLSHVRRFIAVWVLLVTLLAGTLVIQTRALGGYYLTPEPVPGGTYTEGILGSFTNANPLYAVGSVDSSVSRLIFASLFKYDQKNQLVGDLASGWEVDDHGTHYTVHLRPNLMWQDGQPLTAADVAFTYQLIQNPDAKSPLINSWQGISVATPDPLTVIFTLPNPLSSFPDSLTNGIVPKHKLSEIPASQLRSINFNTANPVGAGPFKWQAIEVHGDTPETREERIALAPNASYHAGAPKLDRFIIRSFYDQKHLLSSFGKQELNGMAGLETLPPGLQSKPSIHPYNFSLTSEVMVFLKNSQPVLQDVQVRRALLTATNTNQVRSDLEYLTVPADEPLLQRDVGYDKTLMQDGYDPVKSAQLLDQAGWKLDSDGVRVKDGKPLAFTLFSQNSQDYTTVAKALQKQWRAVGVKADVMLQTDSDLQTTLSLHSYDALLYGISLGTDPDVFAYWHSSQADIRSASRLNFSEYKSQAADQALEAGRTRSDPAIRAIKYKPFLEAWHNDVPAIGLYQPRFLYVTNGQLFGLKEHSANTATDRYANVENWMIHQEQRVK